MIAAKSIAAHPAPTTAPGRVDLRQRIFSPQGSPFFMPNPFRRSVPAGASLLVPALLLCLLSLAAAQAIGTGSHAAHPLPEAAQPHRSRRQRRRHHQHQRLRHRAARRLHHPQQSPHLPQQHGRRTHHPALRRQAARRLRVQLRQLPLHPELHFHAPARPEPAATARRPASASSPSVTSPTRRKLFGVQPYLGAGGGTISFKPTPNGGEGLPFQYRAAYYYNIGVEDTFTGSASHLGIRVGFRQLIYLAPDFQQNYLTITRRTVTSEPTFGLFLRF